MKIGLDARELQRGARTGIGRMVEAVMAEAPALREDVQMFLYTDSSTRSELPSTMTQTRPLPQPATIWFDQVALPKALARDGVDVFWSPYYKAPVSSPCPTAVTIHDLVFLKAAGHRFKNALFKPWARFIGRRAARVLTDSEYSRRDIENILGLDPSLIEVVPLGVSSGFSPAARSKTPELMRRLGIPERYILTVTNFRPHKNDPFLIRAFSRLASSEPEVALVLAGRSTQRPHDVLEAIDQLNLRSRVLLTGLVSEPDLHALYAGAVFFAFPSLDEGFGLPVLEAMASGVPVICSCTGSLPEVAGSAALMLPPTDESAWCDAMADLLADDALREKWARAGYERARVFTWRRSVEKVLKILERIAA